MNKSTRNSISPLNILIDRSGRFRTFGGHNLRQNVRESRQRSQHGQLIERNAIDGPNSRSQRRRLPMLNTNKHTFSRSCSTAEKNTPQNYQDISRKKAFISAGLAQFFKMIRKEIILPSFFLPQISHLFFSVELSP